MKTILLQLTPHVPFLRRLINLWIVTLVLAMLIGIVAGARENEVLTGWHYAVRMLPHLVIWSVLYAGAYGLYHVEQVHKPRMDAIKGRLLWGWIWVLYFEVAIVTIMGAFQGPPGTEFTGAIIWAKLIVLMLSGVLIPGFTFVSIWWAAISLIELAFAPFIIGVPKRTSKP